MQRNIYVLALTTVLAHNASALEIQKGSIIESKQWISGNGSLQVKDAPLAVKNKFNSLALLQKDLKNNKTDIENIVQASSRMYHFPDSVEHDSIVQGIVTATIDLTNTSPIAKTYKVLIQHCIKGVRYDLTGENECFNNKYKVILEPEGKLQNVNDFQEVTFSSGSSNDYYLIHSSITIENINDKAKFYTEDYAYVGVTRSLQ